MVKNMEPNFDELAQIGMEFTLPRVNNRQATKEEIKHLRENINDDIKKTEEKMISIVMKPDPDYINPDPTGNGIAEGMESYEFSVEDEIINGFNDEKYQQEIIQFINTINNHISICQNELIKIDKTLELKDKEVVNSIFNKVVKNLKSTICTHYLYRDTGSKIGALLKVCDQVFNGLSELNLEKFDTYLNFFNNLDTSWLFTREMYEYLNNKDMNSFFTNLEKYSVDYITTRLEKYSGLIINEKEVPLISILANPDNIISNWKECNHNIGNMISTIKIKSVTNTPNAEYACVFIKFIFSLLSAFFRIVLNVSEDIQAIINKIEPTGLNKPVPGFLIDNLEEKDPWIVTDYHLLKELKHGSTDTTRTENIIKMHNSVIKPNDLVLFEGDITEEEYFDMNIIKYIKMVSNLVKKLNGHKIMIMGNNDSGTKDMYLKMGFEEVYEQPLLGKKYLFSHEPQIMTKYPGILNIHGHIHGSKKYYNMDAKNHLDSYYGLYGKPMKLSELVEYYNSGKYNEVEGNVDSDWKDPRIDVEPIKIN